MADIFSYPQDHADRALVKMAYIGLRVGTLERHPHNYAELIIVLEGQAVDVIDEQEHYNETGDVYVVYPGMLHEQRDAKGYRYAILKFDQNVFLNEAGALRCLPGFHLLFSMESGSTLRAVVDNATLSAVEPLIRMMEKEQESGTPESEAVVNHLFMAAVAILIKDISPSVIWKLASILICIVVYFGLQMAIPSSRKTLLSLKNRKIT
jgi:hypothetical protein